MKMKQLVIRPASIALTIVSTIASAGERAYFSKLDIDGDGVLTIEEASVDPVLKDSWSAADTNQDGKLEQAEFNAFETKAEQSIK